MTAASNPRHTTRLSAAALVLVLLALGACGDNEDSATPEASAPSNDTVVVELVAFKPEQLTVGMGAMVTWQQKDPGAHTVTSGTVQQGGAGVTQQPDGKFDSGEVAEGASFEFTFAESGTYPYFCRLHPATMRGEVRVR
ncbi:MAG: plastocyanin/azurin family copper-binding protein [Actinomycetota bacterium]|nr:plastocyanin/azurin family copper-binding protein [Actinomycetota bacterium]